MSEEQIKRILRKHQVYKTELAKKYTTFLSQFPEIFSDLISGFRFDFAIYNSVEEYEARSPMDVFYIQGNGHSIELKPGRATSPDLEFALSKQAVEKLIQTNDKVEYTQLLGYFFNEPDEQKGWVDFILHKRTQTIIDLGYGRFAQTAGILKDDD
jgi:hypothetical protein